MSASVAAPIAMGSVRALVQKISRKPGAGKRIGIHWDRPWTIEPQTIDVDGRPAVVHFVDSALQARELLVSHDVEAEGLLVLLTPCTDQLLGADVLSRLEYTRLHEPDRWQSVLQVFGARQHDRKLNSLPALADALVDAAPPIGYPQPLSGTLDLDTAWRTWASAGLQLNALDPPSLLRASASGRLLFDQSQSDLIPPFVEWVRGTSKLSASILSLESQLGAGEAFSFGLMLPVLFGAEDSHRLKAIGAMSILLDRPLDDSALRSFCSLIETDGASTLETLTARDARQRIDAASRYIERFWLSESIAASSILPEAFEARIRMFAVCLQEALKQPSVKWAAELDEHAIAIGNHRNAKTVDGEKRARVFAMAARAYRYLQTSAPSGGFPDLTVHYVHDGSWADVTWRALWLGDTDNTASQALAQLADKVAERERYNYERFASSLSGGDPTATTGGVEIVPVERILERVVAPLTKAKDVLFVVLDGYALAVHNQVLPGVVAQGWSTIASAGSAGRVGVAMFPTVTEVSRASLFAGGPLVGGMDAERAGFAQAPSIAVIQRNGSVFHQPKLAGAAGRSLDEGLLNAIAGQAPVVAVVVNTVDDTLSKGTFPSVWDLDAIPFLRELLRVAADADRAVVITADHGHIVQQDTVMRAQTESGGERWRPGGGSVVTEDEVLVSGPRVLKGDGSVIMPWSDDVRYAPKKGGYHGGASPAEVLVPLVVLTHDVVPEGWSVVNTQPPAWWTGSGAADNAVPSTPVVQPAKRPAKQETTLFDADDDAAAMAAARPLAPKPAWIAGVLDSELWTARSQTRSSRLSRAQLESLFEAFDRRSGVLSFGMVAEITGTIVVRVQLLLAALSQQCNVDGYAILTTDPGLGEARLDLALLRTQFGQTGGRGR